MNSGTIAAIVLVAFLIFITARGELPVYLAFFVSTGSANSSSSSSSSGIGGSGISTSDISTAAEIAALA